MIQHGVVLFLVLASVIDSTSILKVSHGKTEYINHEDIDIAPRVIETSLDNANTQENIESILKQTGKIVDEYFEEISNEVLKVEQKLWYTEGDLHHDANELEEEEAIEDEELLEEDDEEFSDEDDENDEEFSDEDDEEFVDDDDEEFMDEDDEEFMDEDEDAAEDREDFIIRQEYVELEETVQDLSEEGDENDLLSNQAAEQKPNPHHGGKPKPDPHHGGKPKPDPHHGGKPKPDPHHGGKPHPHHGGKPKPDPHHGGKPKPDPHHGGKPMPDPHHGGKPHPHHGGKPHPHHGGKPHPHHGGKPHPHHGGKPHPHHGGKPHPHQVPDWLRNVEGYLGRAPNYDEENAARAQYVRDMREMVILQRVDNVCKQIWLDRRDRFVSALKYKISLAEGSPRAQKMEFKINFIEQLHECCALDARVECITELHRERNDNYCREVDESSAAPWLIQTNFRLMTPDMKARCCGFDGDNRHRCFGKMRESAIWMGQMPNKAVNFSHVMNLAKEARQQRKQHNRQSAGDGYAHQRKQINRQSARDGYAKRMQKWRQGSGPDVVEARCCTAGKKTALNGNNVLTCERRTRFARRMTRTHHDVCQEAFRTCCVASVERTVRHE